MSHWSRADPLRQFVFVCLLGVVGLIVAAMAVHAVTAEQPDRRSAPGTARVPASPRSPVPEESPSAMPWPSELPSGALTPQQLTVAYNRALSFVDVFANARWDEPAGDRIAKIRAYVSPAALDVILAQYQRVRPREETRETCAFRSTATRWIIVTERQASLIVDGIRTVESAGSSAEAPFAFAVTLKRESGEWLVIAARDPREGNSGAG